MPLLDRGSCSYFLVPRERPRDAGGPLHAPASIRSMARIVGPHRVNAGRGALGSGPLNCILIKRGAYIARRRKKAPRERGLSLRRNVEPENRTCGFDRRPER